MLRLQLTSGGEQEVVEVSGERFVIGREPADVDLLIKDEEASRQHAAFRELPDGRLEIEDLGSRNGTFVDGVRITGPVTLSGGEELKVGATVITVEQPRAAETIRTPAPTVPSQAPPAPPPTSPTGTPVPPPTVVGAPPPSATPTAPIPEGATPERPPTEGATPPPPLPPSQTPTVAVQRDSLQPPGPPQAPAPPKQPGRGRLMLVIAAVLFAVVGAAAIVFVILDDDDSSDSAPAAWDEAFAQERQDACESTGNTAEACGCFVDELQANFSQEEYEQVVAQVDAGEQNESVSKRAEIAGNCGVNLG